jgi:hypothetical protein
MGFWERRMYVCMKYVCTLDKMVHAHIATTGDVLQQEKWVRSAKVVEECNNGMARRSLFSYNRISPSAVARR